MSQEVEVVVGGSVSAANAIAEAVSNASIETMCFISSHLDGAASAAPR